MCKARAAAEIEPVERIASKSAILPGPIRLPFSRSMRIDRRMPTMGLASLERVEASHAHMGRSVKRHCMLHAYGTGPRGAAAALCFDGYGVDVKGAERLAGLRSQGGKGAPGRKA